MCWDLISRKVSVLGKYKSLKGRDEAAEAGMGDSLQSPVLYCKRISDFTQRYL